MKLLLAVFAVLSFVAAFGQAGSGDTTFNYSFRESYNTGFGADNTIRIALKGDSTFYFAGTFLHYNGVNASKLVSVFPDGKINPAFSAGSAFDGNIFCMLLDTNGKLLIGGDFTSYNGTAANRILRLNQDGSIDNSFNPGTGFDNAVHSLLLLADGKILVGGKFDQYNGTTQHKLVQLLADGTVDGDFNQGSGFLGSGIYSSCRLSDGRLLIGGSFLSYNGTNRKGIVRLYANGNIDFSFDAGTGPGGSSAVEKIKLQSDGKVICSGGFSSFNGYSRQYLVRLHPDGSLETGVDVNFNTNGYVFDIEIAPDDKVLLSGEFTTVEYYNQSNLARLNPDMSFDTLFRITTDLTAISQVDLVDDGTILIAGNFRNLGNKYRSRVAMLDNSATVLPLLNPGYGTKGNVFSLARMYNGDVVAGGNFNGYNTSDDIALVKIHPDGERDTSFHNGIDVHPYFTGVSKVLCQPDQKLIVIGDFISYDNDTVNGLCRVDQNGILDPGFNAGLGINGSLQDAVLDNNSRLILSGNFTEFDNIPCNHIVRLNLDGTVDPTFTPMVGSPTNIFYVLPQPDGKLVLHAYYNSWPPNRLMRLNADGTLDNTFNCEAQTTGRPCLTESGNLVAIAEEVTAAFYYVIDQNGMIIDTSEYIGLTSSTSRNGLLETPDNKVLMYGGFETTVNGYYSTGLIRFNENGTFDNTFNPGSGLYVLTTFTDFNAIHAIVMNEDSSFLIGGKFSAYDSIPTNGIARIKNDINGASELSLAFLNVSDYECDSQGTATAVAYWGTPPYSYTWSSGVLSTDSLAHFSSRGIYTCTVEDANGHICAADLLISGSQYPIDFDLNVNLLSAPFRPGFSSINWLNAFNNGCLPVSGQLKLMHDSLVELVSSDPVPSFISGDTLIWNFEHLVYDSAHFIPQLVFLTDTLAAIGDTIHFTVIITPVADDADTTNNLKTYSFPVVNGYDPNIKSVYPLGKCEEAYIKPDQMLTYTVQFQNTGNSEAINIAVVDSLDTDLDLSTVRVIGKSHDMWTEVLPGNVLKFHFDNIQLPDSTSNEPASHGYVIFEAKPVTSWLDHNTEIANKAEIYFDFNPAIVTNTVHNRVYQEGDLEAYNCSAAGIDEEKQHALLVYPNPTSGKLTIDFKTTIDNGNLLIRDVHGRVIIQQSIDNKSVEVVDLSALTNGIYFVSLLDGNGKITGQNHKIIKTDR